MRVHVGIVGVAVLWAAFAVWRESAMAHIDHVENQSLRHFASLAVEKSEPLHPVRRMRGPERGRRVLGQARQGGREAYGVRLDQGRVRPLLANRPEAIHRAHPRQRPQEGQRRDGSHDDDGEARRGGA